MKDLDLLWLGSRIDRRERHATVHLLDAPMTDEPSDPKATTPNDDLPPGWRRTLPGGDNFERTDGLYIFRTWVGRGHRRAPEDWFVGLRRHPAGTNPWQLMQTLDEDYPPPPRDVTVPDVLWRIEHLEREPAPELHFFSSPFSWPSAFLLRPDQPIPSSEHPHLAPPIPRAGVQQMLRALADAPTLTDRYLLLLLAYISEMHSKYATEHLVDLLSLIYERVRGWHGSALPWAHQCTQMLPDEISIDRFGSTTRLSASTCLAAALLAYERLSRFHIMIYEGGRTPLFPQRHHTTSTDGPTGL